MKRFGIGLFVACTLFPVLYPETVMISIAPGVKGTSSAAVAVALVDGIMTGLFDAGHIVYNDGTGSVDLDEALRGGATHVLSVEFNTDGAEGSAGGAIAYTLLEMPAGRLVHGSSLPISQTDRVRHRTGADAVIISAGRSIAGAVDVVLTDRGSGRKEN